MLSSFLIAADGRLYSCIGHEVLNDKALECIIIDVNISVEA